MSNPDEKDKNKQGSSGRPGTKFMERPGSESDAGKNEGQTGQDQTTEGQTGEDKNGDNWKYASPNPKDPSKKTDQDKGQSGRDATKSGDQQQGDRKGSQQDMGKDE